MVKEEKRKTRHCGWRNGKWNEANRQDWNLKANKLCFDTSTCLLEPDDVQLSWGQHFTRQARLLWHFGPFRAHIRGWNVDKWWYIFNLIVQEWRLHWNHGIFIRTGPLNWIKMFWNELWFCFQSLPKKNWTHFGQVEALLPIHSNCVFFFFLVFYLVFVSI